MEINRKQEKNFSFEFQGKNVTFEVDSLNLRVDKSVICRYGNTTILTTLCVKEIEEELDFVRLTVFLEEKFYSVGKIPSGFNKREGRPSYEATVIARLIDRSLRSCFSIEDKKEIQITNTVLSVDNDHDLRLAACWSSFVVSLLSESLSFNKLISTVTVAELENKLICNPSSEQLANSPFELIMTASRERILMLEMFSEDLDESRAEEIVKFAFMQTTKMIDDIFSSFINEQLLTKKLNLKTVNISENNSKFARHFGDYVANFLTSLFSEECLDWNERKHALENFPIKISKENKNFTFFEIEKFWYDALESKILKEITTKNVRIDGRGIDELREISVVADYLPNVHGSALFSRGNTTVISVITIRKYSEKQIVDNALSRDNFYKRFIHHYNFPGFAVNSVSLLKNVSRREVGHGQLVEKTFSRLIPSIDDFPYTSRIVSEVISSEGSSSQASICASSLAMMAAGFPLKKHVAGISLGLFGNTVITDINDLGDKLGEMDFKISGTESGICSFQMDVKNEGINLTLFSQCLEKARISRLLIIQKMKSVIWKPRSVLPSQIPKCRKIYFGSKKVGEIIGQNGKNINFITSKTGVKADFQNDGSVLVYHSEEEKINEALEMMRKSLIR